jgi:hypothetical protein
MKIWINLSKKEILDLKSFGFQLPQRAVISPRRLFGMEELLFNLSSFPTPTSPHSPLQHLQMIIQRPYQVRSSVGTTTPPQ